MIPFPKLHIAQSVLNRVVNTLNDKASPLQLLDAPQVPDPALEGQGLSDDLSTQVPPAQLPLDLQPQGNAAMAASSALGGSPFDAAVSVASGAV